MHNKWISTCRSEIIALLFVVIFLQHTKAEEPSCPNLGFESGDFSNWVAFNWRYSIDAPYVNTPKTEGFAARRHAIITDTTAYDEKTGYRLKKVPSGFQYSARLGDAITNADKSPRCWRQSLRYTMNVDSLNALLIVKFACVLEYADDHTDLMEPRFQLTLFDEKGDTLPDCANYDVFASNSNATGFQLYSPPGSSDPVMWCDWTTVGANLSNYIGQTITLEFMTADCTGHFHFGYAYFVAECQPMNISVKYCSGDTAAVLIAPKGFKAYSWSNQNGTVVGKEQILSLENPHEGSNYTCRMTSATNCTTTLQSTVTKYSLKPDFSSSMIDCASNSIQFANFSTTNMGAIAYHWDFGNGLTSSEKDPRIQFATPGVYAVKLEIANSASSCVESIVKDIELFPPPKVGIVGDTIFCSGQTVVLKAYGADNYTWNTGSKNQTITVKSPGGTYWVQGSTSAGCLSDTIYMTVKEEAGWNMTVVGDTVLCQGDTATIMAEGASKYIWNNGDTSNVISVVESGVYRVTGSNSQGCKRTLKHTVLGYSLPDVNFFLSEETLDVHNNKISCRISPQEGVRYEWDLGDGTLDEGALVRHSYPISKEVHDYTITLIATSMQNCINSRSKTIEVIMFIPNIFTPNGDGINDLFMPGEEVQIMDRNGILLFTGIEGWNGKYRGRNVEPDTYFYQIKYFDRNLNQQTKKGHLTLMR